ncbi:GNAT family N-acetyltransferase [Pseudomonas entomophila]|uniref:GNAT family N-acetyltransferase n=1 Tax=Pseudomonas entomophila TaxID=312306 RepID=UPI003EC137AE
MVELKQRRHVALLFVAPGWQRRGVGARLMQTALAHTEAGEVTVSASLPSVGAYQRYGFVLAGNMSESGGLVYQPMTKQMK